MKMIVFTSRQKVHNKVSYKKYLLAPIENSFFLYELDPQTDKIISQTKAEFEGFISLFDCFQYLKRYYRVVHHRILIAENPNDILGEFI